MSEPEAAGSNPPDTADALPVMHPTIAAARDLLGDAVIADTVIHGEPIITVQREQIANAMRTLRDSALAFEQLVTICGVDYPTRPERFEVVYNLLSVSKNIRLRVKVT